MKIHRHWSLKKKFGFNDRQEEEENLVAPKKREMKNWNSIKKM
jgi:hypothetical protein